MKRKLISFDAFKQIEGRSMTNAQEELLAAEEVLAKTLGVDGLSLVCFGESEVTYKTADDNYIHATYTINNDQLVLENIEELVIEEDSEKAAARSVIAGMVDALLENNEAKANQCFEQFLGMPITHRKMVSEGFTVTTSKPSGSRSKLFNKRQSRSLVAKRIRSRMKTLKTQSDSQKQQLAHRRDTAAKKLGGSSNPRWRTYARKVKKSTMNEWTVMCENVMDYLDYKEFGPTLDVTNVQQDDRGNVTAVAMPNIAKRNEGKILSFNWKTLDHEVKLLRGKVKKIHEDQTFAKAMAELKRYNNISDNAGLQTTLENIVTKWPDVLYLTQVELAEQISNALELAGVKNYGDETCMFMAEGILRTAHQTFTDRVRKINTLAGVTECKECEDPYLEFATSVEGFYNRLDETDAADLRVFTDLYKALTEVHRLANEAGDSATTAETANFLSQCEAVLNREEQPDLDLAEAIANYLQDIVEANVELSSNTWDVSNNTHTTVNGDHPRMGKLAQVNGDPAKHTGDWGGTAPVSDGKGYKNDMEDEMRGRSWGNHSGEGIYPDLKNPYVPTPFGTYKMKEPSAVDDGQNDFSRYQNGDTWPNLQNPYVPKEDGGVGGKGYKMKSDNLVVDK